MIGEGMACYRTTAEIMDYSKHFSSSIANRKRGLSEK